MKPLDKRGETSYCHLSPLDFNGIKKKYTLNYKTKCLYNGHLSYYQLHCCHWHIGCFSKFVRCLITALQFYIVKFIKRFCLFFNSCYQCFLLRIVAIIIFKSPMTSHDKLQWHKHKQLWLTNTNILCWFLSGTYLSMTSSGPAVSQVIHKML